MKKLQKLVLYKATVLTVPQMKHIFAGSGIGGNPGDEGSGGYGDTPVGYGTCGWGVRDGSGWFMKGCTLTKESAMAHVAEFGGNWCCDSCSSTWYCG